MKPITTMADLNARLAQDPNDALVQRILSDIRMDAKTRGVSMKEAAKDFFWDQKSLKRSILRKAKAVWSEALLEQRARILWILVCFSLLYIPLLILSEEESRPAMVGIGSMVYAVGAWGYLKRGVNLRESLSISERWGIALLATIPGAFVVIFGFNLGVLILTNEYEDMGQVLRCTLRWYVAPARPNRLPPTPPPPSTETVSHIAPGRLATENNAWATSIDAVALYVHGEVNERDPLRRDPGTLTTLEWIDLQAYLRSSGKAAKPDDVITVLHALPGQVPPRYIVYWGNDQLAQLPENTSFYSGIDDDPIETPKPVDGPPTNYDEPYVLMESGNLFVVVVHGEQHRVRAKDAAAALKLFERPGPGPTPVKP